jgi:phosphoribosylglycinamide formyltransferase 1
MKRLVILISGRGANMVSIVTACQQGQLAAQVAGVIADRPDVLGLQRAAQLGVKTTTVPYKAFSSRPLFEAALQFEIEQYSPDVVVLAGFMRILTPTFVAAYAGRLLNIHPSLLPLFPGLHTHRQALAARVAEHGATVHEVTAQLDHGPIIEQAKVPVLPGDTEESLAARVLAQELLLYPRAIGRWLNSKEQKATP